MDDNRLSIGADSNWYADLHIHSKYSRATSPEGNLEHLALAAQKKGITLVGSGDITHPAWRAELQSKLIPAGEGIYTLRPELSAEINSQVPQLCRAPVYFILCGEISTIYKKGDRTRKIHHLIYLPNFASAERFAARLSRIGNLNADGRPILGLDSRNLLEIVCESSPEAFLIPAHIWTPWFSVLGSRGGFNSIEECYGDLTPYIFALETGLSSDPEMNWRVSALDRYRLVSNSDAHSPEKLGREATIFTGECNYPAVRRALETGAGYVGTVEFFPEEGKYHLDGHSKCQVRLTPAETRAYGGRCPQCGGELVIGVMNRVAACADRETPRPPATAGSVRSLVPLAEILSELAGNKKPTPRVLAQEIRLLEQFGPELAILSAIPLEQFIYAGEELLAEALRRLRSGAVYREAGYDGEYGIIRIFRPEEHYASGVGMLFSTPPPSSPTLPHPPPPEPPLPSHDTPPPIRLILDPEQRAAVESPPGKLLIVAVPGAGKTHTLIQRIAYLISEKGVAAEKCLAVTFTRRAAGELHARLEELLPETARHIAVHTFHSLGLTLLREHPTAAGLPADFRVFSEREREIMLSTEKGINGPAAQRLVKQISHAKITDNFAADPKVALHDELLRAAGGVDFADLVRLAVYVLETDPAIAAAWQARFPWIFVDEYQDLDPMQHRLVRILVAPEGNLCAIGDPNQAIYGFRGADVAPFHHFGNDWPDAKILRLHRNYRSGAVIVAAASHILADGAQPVVHTQQRIVHYVANSAPAEAEFIVQNIERLLGGHSFFSLDSQRGGERTTNLALNDFAILARSDALFDSLSTALERSGMPFQRRAHTPLSANPALGALLDSWEKAPHLAIASLAEQIYPSAEIPAVAIHQAIELLSAYQNLYHSNPAEIRANLSLLTEADTWDARAARISLLTLHAAKGLEFRVVFILGCEDGLIPLHWGNYSVADNPNQEEERRLFYVGMTRAREYLFLTRAQRRPWRGAIRKFAPSPLLQNLPEYLIESILSEEDKPSAPEKINQSHQFSLF